MKITRGLFPKTTLAGTSALAGSLKGESIMTDVASANPVSQLIELPPLPWAEDALEPHISAKTIGFHYGKHHRAYADNTSKLVKGTPFENLSLEEIIRKAAGDPKTQGLFNNAAQVFNHTFYWRSMKPAGGGEPQGELAERIKAAFGSFAGFKEEFSKAAATRFGSGWAWLVAQEGRLKVTSTGNAETPITQGQVPLITIDVWEHAYYLDFQNRRPDYIASFLEYLADWDFAEKNLARA